MLAYGLGSRVFRFVLFCLGVAGAVCPVAASAQPLPVTVASTETEKAVAIPTGYVISPVSSAIYSSSEDPTAPPFFSLAGGTYNSPQILKLTESTPGARIYYTTNGMVPTTGSTLYAGPISIAATQLVRAVAIAPEHTLSSQAAKAYTFISQAPATPPYFNLAGGSYKTPQTLALTDTTPGATIYYTTNGTTPTTASTQYTGPITISTSELVMAIAAAPGYATSNASSKAYKIDE